MAKELNRPPWFVKACTGYSDLGKAEVVLEGKHFAVVKAPGGPTWAGRGFKPYYSPVRYGILKKDQPFSQNRELVEGRMTKTQMIVAASVLEKLDEAEDYITVINEMGKKK